MVPCSRPRACYLALWNRRYVPLSDDTITVVWAAQISPYG